jgi:hypothetical protein
MFDFIKLKVNDLSTIERLRNNSKLNFKTEVSVGTGEEVSSVKRAHYKTLRFELIDYPNRTMLYIGGSLPKYATGVNNYINMPITDAWQMLQKLATEFDLDMLTTKVIKLEWGLNIALPISVFVDRLLNNMLVYKGRMPSREVFKNGGMMYVIDLNEFSIKIYNKSAQQNTHDNVLRQEIKIKTKATLNRMGIYTMADLFDTKALSAIHEKLLDVDEHLIFYDYNIQVKDVSKRTIPMFLEYNNSPAWMNLMQNNPELYRKKKKSFAKQVTKVSGVDWNKLLQESVSNEAKKLFPTELLAEALMV